MTSHYPLYVASFSGAEFETASAVWYDSDVGEQERKGDGAPWSETAHFESCANASREGEGEGGCTTVKDAVDEAISTLGVLLDRYHVDVYAAGHDHSYSVTWPVFGGALTKKSYVDPRGTVHVTEGNGGVPGSHSHSKLFPCKKSGTGGAQLDVYRTCGFGMNYGRLVTANASVLTYEHVRNADDHATDTWSIVKTNAP